MRTLLGIGMALALAAGTAAGAADEKFDAKKLIGKWQPIKSKKGEDKSKKSESMVVEFTKDGKVVLTDGAEGKEVKIEGTYKLEGDKLTFALKVLGEEVKDTVTLTKLTDDEMAGKSKDNEEAAFKKVKAKPEK
ncbi:hypothetical protein GobsT_22810 [Gemmata obscuriglobus]|uniref:TIGR03066 family protein n=1 Tax=Gemmata obscuriglobus TaxID=114 RepID=A0A2Z3H0Y9_9BACT|nr:TIGR03066 family protein [Gemmata obscuriglobus]AWM39398.1 TIGR03066 family protein [Gemmata obscuriglobus]QEG27525.1 hypothetical protein GobsT_22810 [Gemmata obscuriglobus]VTS04569.1 : Lipocalin_4 [Gemmata obscuriglobus UQM 2246]